MQSVTAAIPPTDGYHRWSLFQDIAVLPALRRGPALLTVNVTGIDNYKEGSQFGNLLWLDFVRRG